jgi:hypothetical protein
MRDLWMQDHINGCNQPKQINYSPTSILVNQVLCMHAQVSNSNISTFDTDSIPIGIDNRCTACISHKIGDFVGPLRDTNRIIRGFGGTKDKEIKKGTIKWKLTDDEGKTHHFSIPNSFYAPNGGVRLLSPQHWSQQYRAKTGKEAKSTTYHDKVVMKWHKFKLTVPLEANTNVATMLTSPGYDKFHAFCAKIGIQDDTEMLINIKDMETSIKYIQCKSSINEQNENDNNIDGLTKSRVLTYNKERNKESAEAEFLRIHVAMGHISPLRIQRMAKLGQLPKMLATCEIPKCAACMFGKATKKPWRTKIPKNPKLTCRQRNAGDLVYIDQLISPTPGLVAQMTGRPTTKRYNCATVFVDHSSDLTFIHLQISTTGLETVEAKKEFEHFAQQNNINISAYHADNGVFAKTEWTKSCNEGQRQALTFAGVNAHHQNGVAEKRIQELQKCSRTMLIHANKRWPSAITNNLWPYAMRIVVDSINNSPTTKSKEGLTPMQQFTQSNIQVNLKHWYPFGSPAYVLQKELQSSNPIFHKWKQRSTVGIYLGHSKQHARTVVLILNLETGLVSPQFHVKVDPTFNTVKGEQSPTSQWQTKCGFVRQTQKKKAFTDDESVDQTIKTPPIIELPPSEDILSGSIDPEGVSEDDQEEEMTYLGWRSKRSRKPIDRLTYAHAVELQSGNIPGEILASNQNRVEYVHPLMALSTVSNPDTMYLHQARKEDDWPNFKQAMQQEVKSHLDNENFILIKKSEIPNNVKILPCVWSLKRKRRIATGEVYRWKARLNLDGSKQVAGIHYDESHASVASWPIIRTMMSISQVNKWKTIHVDFVMAFPQAPVERTLYMDLPKGYEMKDTSQ